MKWTRRAFRTRLSSLVVETIEAVVIKLNCPRVVSFLTNDRFDHVDVVVVTLSACDFNAMLEASASDESCDLRLLALLAAGCDVDRWGVFVVEERPLCMQAMRCHVAIIVVVVVLRAFVIPDVVLLLSS